MRRTLSVFALDKIGFLLVLVFPVLLVQSRGAGEAMVALLASLFLLRSVLARDWVWSRAITVRISLIWWGWVVFCALLSADANPGQALALLRWPLLVAALEFWLLRSGLARRSLLRLLQVALAYIMAQEAVQFLFGSNLFGIERRPSGELTGPYRQAIAGPIVSRLIFPAALPPAYARLARGSGRVLSGGLILCACVASVVLFGQRMPMVLTVFGLLIAGLLLPRLRWPSLLALLAGTAIVAGAAWFSPPTFDRLVVRFSEQLSAWPTSDYGNLAARAVSIAQAHPIFGRGFDSFQRMCMDRAYWHGWPDVLRGATGFHPTPQPPMTDMPAVWAWLHDLGGGYAICAQHPHNHYLQALVESGVPGLVLFCAMILAWGRALLAGATYGLTPLRTGLFIAFVVQEWPIASTSDFVNMPLGGWFFLLLGFGLAQARYEQDILIGSGD